MSVQSRLLEFIHSKQISISDFERNSNLSNGYVHKIKNTVGKRAMWDIQRAYPELNSHWLLTGEGEMLNPAGNTATANGTSSIAAINSHVTLESNEVLKERVKHLEELLTEKERLIKVYEKMMEGK